MGDQKVFRIIPFFTSTAGQVPHRLEGGGRLLSKKIKVANSTVVESRTRAFTIYSDVGLCLQGLSFPECRTTELTF